MPIHDPNSAEVSEAHLFVAVLGASNRIYAAAFAGEKLESWISAHCHAYAFYGGVARITVPDFVPGNIIDLLCPILLCGRQSRTPVFPRESGNTRAQHNAHSDLSHFSKSASSLQTGFRGNASEEADDGGSQVFNASCFIRMLISA